MSDYKEKAITIVPAAPEFYALFLSPKDLAIPRQFFSHAVVAWQVHQCEIDGEDSTSAWPVCVTENGDDYNCVLQPDGRLVHKTGFISENIKEALAYELDQETPKRVAG